MIAAGDLMKDQHGHKFHMFLKIIRLIKKITIKGVFLK